MLDAHRASSHSPTGKARGTLPFGLLDRRLIRGGEECKRLAVHLYSLQVQNLESPQVELASECLMANAYGVRL